MVAPNTPPWQRVHDGKRWTDMPGTNTDIRKMNFYLFRKGLLVHDAMGGWWNRDCKTGQMEPEELANDEGQAGDAIPEQTNQPTTERDHHTKTTHQGKYMNPTDNNERKNALERLKKIAKGRGLTMRQLSKAIGCSDAAFSPSKALEYKRQSWQKIHEDAKAYLDRVEVETIRPPESVAPVICQAATASEDVTPAPASDPLDRIVELGHRIREMREEVRRLALAL